MNQAYWDERYQQNKIGWDLGAISTPLKDYFDQLTERNLRILIPGGGNSYEAEYLLQQGFTDVTVVDVSEVIVQKLTERLAPFLNESLTLLCQDFFSHSGQYDLIVEQTFFCALDPSLRPDYVRQMHELLRENGKLAGVLFDRDFVGGPPFGGNRTEYQDTLGKYLDILVLEPCYNSVPPRAGSEAFLIAKKIPGSGTNGDRMIPLTLI